MSSITLVWKYLMGMKRKFIMTFLSIIVLFMIIQGVFIFAFNVQQKEVQLAMNCQAGDLRVSLYKSNASYESRIDVINKINSFRYSLDQNKIGWDGSYAYAPQILQSFEAEIFFVDDFLMSVFGIDNNETNQVYFGKPFAQLLNVNESTIFNFYNLSFSVSYLDFEKTEKLNEFLLGQQSYTDQFNGLFIGNIIIFSDAVLRNSSFHTVEALTYYYTLQYNRSLFESARFSTNYDTVKLLTLEVTSQLELFLTSDIQVHIHNRLLYDFGKIQKITSINLLVFFLFSSPLLLAGLFFYGTTLRSTRKKWLQELYVLWHRGFSRKQSFKFLIEIYLLFDVLILVSMFTILIIESLILGLIIDLTFWLLFSLHILLILLAFILQIQEIYRTCFPDIEKTSIMSAEKGDFKQIIDFILKKPKIRKKYVGMAVGLFVIGILLLNYVQLVLGLQKVFNFNSFPLLFTSSGGPNADYIGVFFTFSGLALVIVSLIIIVIIVLNHLLQFGNILFLGRRKNKEKLRVFQKIFKRSIYKNKKIGFLIFILFFGFSFTWVIVGSTIVEEQNDVGVISTPDMVLIVDKVNQLPEFEENIRTLLTRSEIEVYTSIFHVKGIIITEDKTINIDIKIIDPITLPSFLEEGLDAEIFEFQSTEKVFQRMQEDPTSCVIDMESFTQYGLKRDEDVILSIILDERNYVQNGSIIDIARFDATNPRGSMNQHILIPMQMVDSNLNLTNARYIYMNFKNNNQLNSFREIMYDEYNIPQDAIIVTTQIRDSYLVNYLLFLESTAALVILLISIPVILELFYSNLQTIAKLYSRGFSYKSSLKNVFAQYFIFWFNYSFLGSLIALSLLGMLKWILPKILLGQYRAIHFEISSIIALLGSLISVLLIPIFLVLIVIRLPSHRTRMLSTLILTNEERQIG